MGKLQGVKLTPMLQSVSDAALALPQPASPAQSESGGEPQRDDGASSPPPSSSSSTSPRSSSSSSPAAIMEKVQRTKHDLLRRLNSAEGARSAVETATARWTGDEGKNDETSFLPLAAIEDIKFLIDNSSSDPSTKAQLRQRLESALRGTTLSFAPKPAPKKADPAFQKRLERLRLQSEERSYSNLTTNLKNASSIKDDEVTAKSMMYATSVGLNMVVAPASFGVFMYFFAGSIFSRFFDDEDSIESRGNNIDIRRVIAGVVSGVFMLFVEMILFVIRSHELDASVRKKGQRRENRANPFGYTQKSMARTYIGDE